MKLKDLFEQQNVIEWDIKIPNEITTLVGYEYKGTPIAGAIVKGVSSNFDCSRTKITSLEGGPSHVDGGFFCDHTEIASLEGGPIYVGGDFYCYSTNITSLVGAPNYIGGNFNCVSTNITSLQNVHEQIKSINGKLYLPNIRSHILGVFFIKGLKGIELTNKSVQQIVNKHLAGRDSHSAQEELIEAGLSEYAKA